MPSAASSSSSSAYHIAIGRPLRLLRSSSLSSLESSVSFRPRLCCHDFHHLLNVFLGFQVPQTHTHTHRQICFMRVCLCLVGQLVLPFQVHSCPSPVRILFPSLRSLAFCNLLVFFSALYKLCSLLLSSALFSSVQFSSVQFGRVCFCFAFLAPPLSLYHRVLVLFSY